MKKTINKLEILRIFEEQRINLKEELDNTPFGYFEGLERIKAKKELLDSLLDKFNASLSSQTKDI